MTPPTAATSSTIEVISNASRWSVRNSRPISAGLPNAALDLRPSWRGARPPRGDRDDDLDEERAGGDGRRPALPARPARPGRVGSPPEVGDHEQEHHHHRAGVDEHLRGGDELGREQQVEHRERAEVPDQRERREERVREADDRERRAEARERGDDPDDPDERRCRRTRRSRVASCSRGSACRRARPGRRPAPA